ncbi:hypothetical protein GCM10007362_42170 [Saccharibacillus endophyticus]|uniref:Uncharacterized protein n=1 Tax=Saccharibacillus endophyticus TaxID=2060666 RepID=A0ABQ2A6E7_9BACL|nr:hypothetical protein GCM10007362_42170 [Saccharibacillus endophyticus]
MSIIMEATMRSKARHEPLRVILMGVIKVVRVRSEASDQRADSIYRHDNVTLMSDFANNAQTFSSWKQPCDPR